MPNRKLGLGVCLTAVLAGWGCKEEITPPPPAPPPSLMSGFRGVSQTGEVGASVSAKPAVKVVGDNGQAVPGVTVNFSITGGGGSGSGLSATTDANGIAQVVDWVLGSSPGINTMVAQASGLPTVTFSASGSSSKMNIVIRYEEDQEPTATQQAAFLGAAATWASLLIGDLSDIPIINQSACSASNVLNETVDDLLILAGVGDIDGPGGILAQAGPCLVRNSNNLPVVGQMEFDQADLASLETAGSMEEVIAHEMGHVLGFGASLWSLFTPSLIANASLAGGVDPYFTGAQALIDFDAVGGATYTGNKVPLADVGGAGSQDSHWRELVFANELMTPIINTSGTNPLSRVTVGAFKDMGYTTSPAGADPYTLPPFTVRVGPSAPGLDLGDDLIRGPVKVVDGFGRVVGSLMIR